MNTYYNVGRSGGQNQMGYNTLAVLSQTKQIFDTIANAKLQSEWDSLINANKSARCLILPRLFNFAAVNNDVVKVTGAQTSEVVRDGDQSFTITYSSPRLDFVKQLKSLNGQKFWAAFITSKGGFKFISKDGVKVEGREINLYTTNLKEPVDSNNLYTIDVTIDYINPDDYSKYGQYIETDPSTNPLEVDYSTLEGITDCEIIVNSASTSEANLTVRSINEPDFLPTGLVAANFVLKKAGTPVVVTVTEETDGTYTLAYTTTDGAHTIGLATQPAGTKGFETRKDTSFSIVTQS